MAAKRRRSSRRSRRSANARGDKSRPRETVSVFYAPDGIWSLDEDEDEEDVLYPAGWYYMRSAPHTGTGPFFSSQEAEANARATSLGTNSILHFVIMPPAPYSQAVRRRMSAYP